MRIREIDKRMAAKGYVTPRMIAEKVGVHVFTVRRMITDERIPAREIIVVGNTQYIHVDAIASAFGEASKVLDLSDWTEYGVPQPSKRKAR